MFCDYSTLCRNNIKINYLLIKTGYFFGATSSASRLGGKAAAALARQTATCRQMDDNDAVAQPQQSI
jgi:hypothetical protein